MSCLFYVLWILYGVFFARYTVAQTGNSSFPRTSYTYYLDSGLPSTWFNNNTVIMDEGKKMRVILVIQDYNRKIGFYCGFYSDGSSDLYSLAVVAVVVADAGDHNVVWSTDGNSFVKENASLQLTRDEGLVLRDSDGGVVWSSAQKSDEPVVGMNLTEAGNLVLFGNEGTVLWQSFDYPKDTLLIGQKLYKDQKLVPSFFSTKENNSPFFATLTTAPYFSAFFKTSDGHHLMYYQLDINSNTRNHSVLQYGKAEQKEFVENMGTSDSESSKLLGSIVFVKLDQDGRLRTYTYNTMSWRANIVDMVTQECQNSSAPHFLKEVRDITYPNMSSSDIGVVPARTINDCKKACMQNCSCIAFVFRNGKDVSDRSCYMPSEIYYTEHNSTGQSNLLAFIKVLENNGGPDVMSPEAPSSSWIVRHRNSSFPRTSYTYYLDTGLPSTWFNNNIVIMDGGKKMRVILVIQDYNRKIGFYCGFYSDGSSDLYSLAVVAVVVADAGDHNVVWSTDGNSFVKENASLQLTRDEGLVLRDSDGGVVWSSAQKSDEPVVGMNLTEAGNLVLFGNEGTVLWQSFDYPKDTLLIGQKLYKDQKLVPSFFSTKENNSPFFATLTTAPYFSAFFKTSDGHHLMYYQLEINSNTRNHSVLQYGKAEQKEFVENMGTSDSESSKLLGSIVFVKLDQDGRLRTYTYNTMSWRANIVDMVTQECQNSSAPHFLKEVRDITYPNMSSSDIGVVPARTINDCKKACMQNCSCIAFVFRNGKDVSDRSCYMPSEIYYTEHNSAGQSNLLAFIKVLENNGGPDVMSPEAPSSSWIVRHRKEVIITAASTTGGVAMIVLVFLVMSPKNQNEDDGEENLKQALGMPLRFSLEELLIATENFKETLGVGGFGSVFKGILAENGTRIAVKRLDKMSQGMREFLAEVETIGNLHHFNLVRLVGFCAEKSCRLLVYEYMSNGSLNNWIFNPDQSQYLDWQTRMNIILDIAKGLAYLHEECRQKIIHLDIKPHNILLDEDFHAKVSDFGLSKLIERDESQVLIPMRGTPGYLAPELQKSIVTVKADVYSFGIVVLEIVSRRRNVDSSRSESSFHLLEMLQKKAEEDNLIEVVEDLDEDMLNNREEVIKMIRIGAWCLQNDHTKRPSMSTVVKVLEGVMEVDPDISYKFTHAMAFASDANDHITVAPQASFLSAPR